MPQGVDERYERHVKYSVNEMRVASHRSESCHTEEADSHKGAATNDPGFRMATFGGEDDPDDQGKTDAKRQWEYNC